MQLEMWFDGEAPEGLGWHLATCTSCFRVVDKLSRIRGAVRDTYAGAPPGVPDDRTAVPALRSNVLSGSGYGGAGIDESVLAGLGSAAPTARSAPRLRALAAVPVVLLVVAGLVIGVNASKVHGTLSAAQNRANTSTAGSSAGNAAAGSTSGSNASGTSTRSTGGANHSSSTGSAAGGAVHGVLTLAVVVPTQGTAQADGTEITQAVQKAVAEANAAGGVDGSPVQLTIVPAENTGAVAALAGHVTALVGGFGSAAPVGVPWILPADPWAAGSDIVSAEMTPRTAGAMLGTDLLRRGVSGTVGVVEGPGPDADLAKGLAAKVPVTVVQAPSDTTCLPALAQLEQQGVVAVAVAGSPTLSSTCVGALGALAWAPQGGVLVAPSAAYAGVASAGAAGAQVFTVLGLPWPASSSAGAQRFRSALPGVTSYRALVSYAAVEMAVQVARSTGSDAVGSVAAGNWRNDLYDFAGTTNAGAQVVEESAGGWVSAP
ncbi:MAG: ABC transporter substrate-binding protein [Acidimicrobiales bacterium]